MCGTKINSTPVVTGTCLRMKEENQIHNKQVADSGVYASFSDLKFVPECIGNGMYAPTQCDDTKKVLYIYIISYEMRNFHSSLFQECWCVTPSGNEIKGTRKLVGGIFANTLKPDCEKEVKGPDGPCFHQA